jgi:DNA polymerase-3 subunit alpha
MKERAVKTGKNQGRKMASLVLEDLSGSCPAVCFPEAYESLKEHLATDAMVFIKGKMDPQKEEVEIIVEDVLPLKEGLETLARSIKVHIAGGESDIAILELRKLCGFHHGECRLFLSIESDNKVTTISASDKFALHLDDQLLQEIENLMGREAVELRTS